MDRNLGFINNQIWMKIWENIDGFVLFNINFISKPHLHMISGWNYAAFIKCEWSPNLALISNQFHSYLMMFSYTGWPFRKGHKNNFAFLEVKVKIFPTINISFQPSLKCIHSTDLSVFTEAKFGFSKAERNYII